MEVFAEYLAQIKAPQHRTRMEKVLEWVGRTFRELEPKIAWNQPMFTDHGTFIIAFSAAAKHLAGSTERAGMEHFTQENAPEGTGTSGMLLWIPGDREVHDPLVDRVTGR